MFDACLNTVREALPEFQHRWSDLYLVGGTVRDILRVKNDAFIPDDRDLILLNPSNDFNLTTVTHSLVKNLNGRLVVLDEDWGIYRVVIPRNDEPDITYDVALAEGNDLTKDLARRDLTINAMAVNVASGELLDSHGGQTDLTEQMLRFVAEKNVVDDPLRLIRLFRFAATLGDAMVITPDSLAIANRHKDLLWKAAPERIQAEWLKLLSARSSFKALIAMADCGLLEVLLPELASGRKIPPNGYHHLSLWDHTLEVFRQAEIVLDWFPELTQGDLLKTSKASVSRFGLIKFACLLHDIAKPDTKAVRDDGRFTYYGHDQASETLSKQVCKRLKLSTKQQEAVCFLVRWHLYPCQFNPESSQKSLLRFFRRMGDFTPDLLLLALADRLSATGGGQTQADIDREIKNHLWLMDEYNTLCAAETLKQPPLLNGNEIMALLDLPPGPKVGEFSSALVEAQQLGEVTSVEGAQIWLKQHVTVMPSN